MADSSFEIQIKASTDGVQSSGKAVESLTSQLEAANRAADKATGQYNKIKSALEGVQKQIESASIQQAILNNKLEKAQNAGNTRKVAALQRQLEDLASTQTVLAKQEERLNAHYKDKSAALDKARAAVKSLELAQRKQAEASKAVNLNELQEGLAKLGGPFGRISSHFVGLAAGFSKIQKATGSGLVAIVASLGSAITFLADGLFRGAMFIGKIALGVGLAAGGFGIMAARAIDAARTQQALYAGITQSTKAAGELSGSIDRVAAGVPLSRDEVGKLGEDLARSGLRGKELDKALEGASVQAARLKFGPEWQSQMLSLPKQLDKLQSNFRGLFANIKIDKALVAFSRLVELFDSTTASGRALQAIAERFFGAVIGKSDDLAVAIEAMALKAEIAVMTFLLQWRDGSGEYVDRVNTMIEVGKVLWAGLVLVVQILTALAATFVFLGAAAVGGLTLIATTVATVFTFVSGAITAIIGFIAGIFTGDFTLFDAGVDMIQGFIDGIVGTGAKVLEAVTGVASDAVNAAKSILGIASPSKVFADIGANTAAGMAVGVESGTSGVQSAVEGITSPSNILPEPTNGTSAGTAGGTSASISGATFNFYGVAGAEDARAKFEETLIKVLQGAITQSGGGFVGA